MRNKLLCLLLCLAVILSAGTPAVTAAHVYTVAEVENYCDGIVGFKCGSSAQQFIDTKLCDSAGNSAEFYIIALSQQGKYDFSSYEQSLIRYLKSNEVYSATSREKYALALIASGSNNAYITRTADEAIGGLGLMSLVFGLHLLNNGCTSKLYTTKELISTILGYQLSDGGWAVIGNRGDVDVTAMTLQSLAPYYRSDSSVKTAVNRALSLLSECQQSDGGFSGMGAVNCESAAQVLTALSDLGIDQSTDSRFLKNGNSVLDAILRFRNADGSFCHVAGGGYNESATMQSFYAMTAYIRHLRGKGPLYVLDNRYSPTAAQTKTPSDRSQEPTQKRSDEQKQSGYTTQNGAQNNVSDNDQNAGIDTSGQENQPDNSSGTPNNENSQQQQTIAYADNQSHNQATESPSNTATDPKLATEAESVTQPATSVTESFTESPTVRDVGEGAGIFQPTGKATEAPTAVEEAQPGQKGGYKFYVIATILAAAAIASLILCLLKKRNKKNFIAVAILAALAILFVLQTNFESKEGYRAVPEKTDTVGNVTLTIRCDTLMDDDKPYVVPDDCIILDTTDFTISDGDTVYDILLEASKRYELQIDSRGAAGNAYIASIQYLYEFDYGDLSGWMYRVNGEFPDVGCQSYTLRDGDTVEWLYTKNIGKDLE